MSRVRNMYHYKSSNPPDAIWTHKGLSLPAKGLFAYMWTKPDNWNFFQGFIAEELELSVSLVRKYVKELLNTGWITRERVRTKDGKLGSYDYRLHVEPCSDFTMLVNHHVGKTDTIYNNIYTTKNKYTVSEKKSDKPKPYKLNYNANFIG